MVSGAYKSEFGQEDEIERVMKRVKVCQVFVCKLVITVLTGELTMGHVDILS